MPVARVITQNPEDSQELCRQLIAAGYSVKFAAPDEEFDPGDLVVAAATVHRDYALQYAAEVAQQSDAEVIVAPGVVPGSFPRSEPAATLASARVDASEESAVQVVVEPSPVADRVASVAGSLRSRWEKFSAEREITREQRRLQRERKALEAEERRQQLLRARAEEEARMSAERERLRLERQAAEAERRRAAEMERQRIAEEQARLAAQREQWRVQRQAEEEQRRAAEEERIRAAASARAEAERQRVAEDQRRLAEVTPAAPPSEPEFVVPAIVAPPPVHGAAPVAAAPRQAVSAAMRVVQYPPPSRQRQLQRAVLLASLVALFAMIGFALAMNVDSRSPLPNDLTNNSVQEQSPFGPAHTAPQPATTTVIPPRAATPAPVVRPQPTRAIESKPPAAVTTPHRTARQRTRRSDDDVAEDQVIIHHYGAAKHPPASGTSASIPRYSDQQ